MKGKVDWISVEEKLPNENTPVIAYFSDRGSAMLCHYFKDFSLVRCGLNGFEPHGVTHWAEINKP